MGELWRLAQVSLAQAQPVGLGFHHPLWDASLLALGTDGIITDRVDRFAPLG
jgi:hypothetical protein